MTAHQPQAQQPAAPVGTIHDLGYRRYLGTRRGQNSRWQVIAIQQFRAGWKGFWRFKSPLLLAVINTVFWLAVMTAAPAWLTRVANEASGGRVHDAIAVIASQMYLIPAVILSLTLGSGIVAGDRACGAFPFYFSRPVRARDYALGKLLGLSAMFALLLIVGPLIIGLVRIGLNAGSPEGRMDHILSVPKLLAVNTLVTMTMAAVPLAFSSLISRRRYAIAVFAAYWFVGGGIASGLGAATGLPIGALSLGNATQSITQWVLAVPMTDAGQPPASWSLLSLGGHLLAAVAIVAWRISAARRSGLGSSS